jgi:hypothetical protein
MRTPTVRELPRELQPTHHDPFIDRMVVPGCVVVVRPGRGRGVRR